MTVGIRRDSEDRVLRLDSGEFGKDSAGRWFCRPPLEGATMCNLADHMVIEHKSGTITVSPEVIGYNYRDGKYWYGTLRHGVWRKAGKNEPN